MKFRYTAKDQAGKSVSGTVEAGDKRGAALLVREQKMTPLVIQEKKGGIDFTHISVSGSKVKGGELSTFTRQLATMINAGLPLTDALTLLKMQSSPALSKVVGAILVDVQAGVALSTAMEKHPHIFSKVYTALVKAGEAAGVMETILNRLADTSEKSRELRGKVIGAMIYPAIIILAMIGVMAVVMLVVMPKMNELYADFDAELPFATRMLVGTSEFALNNIVWIVIGLVGLVIGGSRYIGSENGRQRWDTMIYRVPIVGPLAEKMMLAELTRTMSLLVGAGVSIVEVLNIVADGAGNLIAEKELKKIGMKVEKGFPVSISFSESPLFPPIVGQMLAVGEETGKMDDVLAKLSHYFESEAEEKIKGLTTAIEPIILVIMAVGVGFLMYAVVMPMYTIMDQI
jgi:type IV pilus assembly protein PilC